MRVNTAVPALLALAAAFLPMAAGAQASVDSAGSQAVWQSPAEDLLQVLHAPRLPRVWTAPGGDYLLLADPVVYPHLTELAAPVHKLAGIRVDPRTNGHHGRRGYTSPRLVEVAGGGVTELGLPDGAEVHDVDFSADGMRFALAVCHADHIGLWVGSANGDLVRIDGLELNPLLGDAVQWLPDGERLLVLRAPGRGPVPEPPPIPAGPAVAEGAGEAARSTYEARDLLRTAYDDSLFSYYCRSQPVVVDRHGGEPETLVGPAHYHNVAFSPDGRYVLVERLAEPWSHEVAWWRFPREIGVWNADGAHVADIASLPLADEVPVHGVPTGPRSVAWRPTAPHELYWIEALDGGDPVADAPFRDRLMRLEAPFTGEPEEVFRTEHRMMSWQMKWGGEGGTLMLGEYERMRRWLYIWLVDVDSGDARLWFDRDAGDRYGDPGSPVMRQLPSGGRVMHQKGDSVYFRGSGATEGGDRPFLDLRHLGSDGARRLFRCPPGRYEYFVAFAGGEDRLVLRSESPKDVPNYYLATLGRGAESAPGEDTGVLTMEPITDFRDPAPRLREASNRLVRYERGDGVPLSFQLYLPPGYEEGTLLPTVVSAYPLEYSGASTAGQVRGSTRRFLTLHGASSLFFLLRGYAVLSRTSMPMIGDPETTYDTFVPQLVADAEAAVQKVVEMGVADPDRIGVIGHSHGGLMVAHLLAHTDLFSAGIARSGSYNKTNQPFGFQAERRSLFEARDVYIQVSPLFFADEVDEPVLIIHGEEDSNPGTRTFQSEIFFEAVRGSGGTVRLVLLPFEDHGYRARESVEHVLWEQMRWFDRHVRGADAGVPAD